MSAKLFPQLEIYLSELIGEAGLISRDRKDLLLKLSNYVEREKDQVPRLNFICTHNSRRSHLAQIWAAVAATWYNIEVATFSGGTEATAFNPRAVAALKRAGFKIIDPGGENPHYLVYFSETAPPLECWSKKFDDPANPRSDFAGIMTCSDADENCPFIPGLTLRLPLTYDDPKVADDTPDEKDRYDDRVRQIGREIFFAFSHARK